MTLLAKNVLVNAIYYGLTVVLLPASLLHLEQRLDSPFPFRASYERYRARVNRWLPRMPLAQ